MNIHLTNADCETILKRYLGDENFQLIGYSHRPISENVEGIMGHHLWLTIQYKREGKELEKIFFLKTEPTDFEMMLEWCENSNLFKKEIFFYDKIVPEFKKYNTGFNEALIPKFYIFKSNKLVVMENCEADGYKNINTLDIWDLNHLKLLLEAFANLHASSIIYEERKSKELGREYRLNEDYNEYLEDIFYFRNEEHPGFKYSTCSEKCILALIDEIPKLDDLSKEKLKQKFAQFAENSFELSKPSKQFRNVLCHADLTRRNVLYKYDKDVPVSCKVIDFQLIKYSPPIYDVMKCIYQVASLDMIQHHLNYLINYYYDHVQEDLKAGNFCPEKVLPYSELILSAEHLLPYILVEALFYYTFNKIPPECLNEIVADKEVYKVFVFSDRSEIVKRHYKPGTSFQIWMDELLFQIKDLNSVVNQ